MNKTSIEWVRNPDGTRGYTWNPITGCLNHVNGMCKGGNFPCYSYKLANGILKERYLANQNVAPYPDSYSTADIEARHKTLGPFHPRFWPERLGELTKHRKPVGVAVCDMGELFGDWIPQEWQDKIFEAIRACPQHRFYLLTKQPQNLPRFSPFPENCWVGVTITKHKFLADALVYLPKVEAKVKYLSLEPLLGGVTLKPQDIKLMGLNWLVIGSQTKPCKPPKAEWVQEIVETADRAGVPVFLKDNLRPVLPYPWSEGKPLYDWVYTSKNGEVKFRQEMPDGTDKKGK